MGAKKINGKLGDEGHGNLGRLSRSMQQ